MKQFIAKIIQWVPLPVVKYFVLGFCLTAISLFLGVGIFVVFGDRLPHSLTSIIAVGIVATFGGACFLPVMVRGLWFLYKRKTNRR